MRRQRKLSTSWRQFSSETEWIDVKIVFDEKGLLINLLAVAEKFPIPLEKFK